MKYLILSRSRITDTILARNCFKRIKRFKTAVKTIFLSSFFENEVSFTVDELFNKSKLVKGLNFEMLLTDRKYMRKFLVVIKRIFKMQ